MNQPQTVWRVECNDNAGNGLTPRGHPDFQEEQDFKSQQQRHLNWVRFASPFISTFSDKAHVIRWGRKRAIQLGSTYYDNAMVYEIDTRNLEMHRGRQVDEYLIVGAIPQENIQRMTKLRGEVDRMASEKYERLRQNEKKYWGIQTQRWYIDEDEEQEEIDENDFIEYMWNH